MGQGRDQALEYLRTHPDPLKVIEAKIRELSGVLRSAANASSSDADSGSGSGSGSENDNENVSTLNRAYEPTASSSQEEKRRAGKATAA